MCSCVIQRYPRQKFAHSQFCWCRQEAFASLMARGTLVEELKEPKASGERVSPESLLVQSAMAIVKQYESNYIDKVGSHIGHIEQRMRSHEATNDDFFDFVTTRAT